MNQTKISKLPVLLIDDEPLFLHSCRLTLRSVGIINTIQCQDSRHVMALLSNQAVSVIILDMGMPYLSGWDLLPMITQNYPDTPVIIITAYDEVKSAVQCMRQGAFDYIVKPVDAPHLEICINRALEHRELLKENCSLKEYLISDKLAHPEAFSKIISNDKEMLSIFQYIEAIAETALPALITGETGVGKELVAETLHSLSHRQGEFVTLNLAGVDDNLFSDTLFGHKKGGFTGAHIDRKGLLEEASGGTLFLDEIGDLCLESQVKLLRLIQERRYYPIGSDIPKKTDARIIVATNRDLTAMQEEGEFRKDLYYRLQVHHIHLPPLRERINDIPLLLEYFLQHAADTLLKKKPTPPKELVTLLQTYDFPGNIRELETMIFDAVSRHKAGVLSIDSIKKRIGQIRNSKYTFRVTEDKVSNDKNQALLFSINLPTLKETEQILISEAMKRAQGNQTIAAQLLGMTRSALNKRLNKIPC